MQVGFKYEELQEPNTWIEASDKLFFTKKKEGGGRKERKKEYLNGNNIFSINAQSLEVNFKIMKLLWPWIGYLSRWDLRDPFYKLGIIISSVFCKLSLLYSV